MRVMTLHALLPFLLVPVAFAQNSSEPPSTWPHVYPGQPDGDYSPAWQSYFEVTDPLPNITFDIGRNFAGNIGVQRDGHPNDTLFFWAVESSNGSLTTDVGESDKPWAIWLNGGPGSSSFFGFFFENGPIRMNADYSASPNPHSWNTLVDYIWVDQPVGVGFSTADRNGYVDGEDQMGEDFLGFLGNLVKVFPSLATRPLYITGESYAGDYIPYITKAYFGMENPPVNLSKIAIGDGSIGDGIEFIYMPSLTVLETWPAIIGYDQEVFKYFSEQSHLCGYDINLTYPQDGLIPTINPPEDAGFLGPGRKASLLAERVSRGNLLQTLSSRYQSRLQEGTLETRREKRDLAHSAWKTRRDLSGRANGTIDPWYGCFLLDEFMAYALNYTYPWNITGLDFDVYSVPDALSPEANQDASVFMNDDAVRAALHAPTSKNWTVSFEFPFGDLGFNDPSPPPMVFLTDMATNASDRGVSVVIYSGNDDALVSHRGSEVVIQNTTFGGIQGFTRKPSTPWYDDDGNFAGIVHQERNWTYVLFSGTGHMVPTYKPEASITFLREFVFGNNQTGLLVPGSDTVVGGEDPALAEDVLPGDGVIFYGSGTTTASYTFPAATIEAWSEFIATETATASALSSAASATAITSSALATATATGTGSI